MPFTGIDRDNKDLFLDLFLKNIPEYKTWVGGLFLGPGGFRELREAFYNNFHPFWHLSDSMVASYGRKLWGGFCSVYGRLYNGVLYLCMSVHSCL